MVIWLLGKPNSGKTTIGEALIDRMKDNDIPCELLDGNKIRGLGREKVGEFFSKNDRISNCNSVRLTAQYLLKNKIIPVVALITPYESSRELNRAAVTDYFEVYCMCEEEELIKRDKKMLYGFVSNLTGIDGDWEEPEESDLLLCTDKLSVEDCVNLILSTLHVKVEVYDD